jgi:pseudouridine synthase
MISAGRVRVNGQTAELGCRVGPDDEIALDDRPLSLTDPEREVWALHKPPGYLSTARDERGRPTVLDLVPSQRRLYPIGRLDLDSEGLLLLTDDGELANLLTHPRHHVAKRYRVLADRVLTGPELERLRGGVGLEDGWTHPCEARALSDGWLELVLHEGRNRQIRRMLASLGVGVRRLLRVQVGPLALGELECGICRRLTAHEVEQLRRAVGGRARKAP